MNPHRARLIPNARKLYRRVFHPRLVIQDVPEKFLKIRFDEQALISSLSEKKYLRSKKEKGTLRIFAAFHNYNWEEQNLLPALARLGEVIWYDWDPPYSASSYRLRPSNKYRMNQKLIARVQEVHASSPIDLFFGYLSGALVYPETVEKISNLGFPTINLSLDDSPSFWGNKTSSGLSGISEIAPFFTVCWTSSLDAVAKYLSVGATPIHMPPGADPELFKPLEVEATDIDVSFVGQRHGVRADFVRQLSAIGVNVQTFGRGWKNGPVSYERMLEIFARSKITLGFGYASDSAAHMQLKGRDFEAPMAGAFYLTTNNPELRKYFEVGKEIEVYNDVDDLRRKVLYYLKEQPLAREIRRRARQRAVADHTWESRFERLFKLLEVVSDK